MFEIINIYTAKSQYTMDEITNYKPQITNNKQLPNDQNYKQLNDGFEHCDFGDCDLFVICYL